MRQTHTLPRSKHHPSWQSLFASRAEHPSSHPWLLLGNLFEVNIQEQYETKLFSCPAVFQLLEICGVVQQCWGHLECHVHSVTHLLRDSRKSWHVSNKPRSWLVPSSSACSHAGKCICYSRWRVWPRWKGREVYQRWDTWTFHRHQDFWIV